jgi:hypothetical protein
MTSKQDSTEDPWEATGEGWEKAETSIGSPIDWQETPELKGIFIESGVTASSDGEEFPILAFIDSAGLRVFAWESPDLRHAFKTIPKGAQVLVTHLGKEDIGKGRSVNRFDVRFKAPADRPVPPSEPQGADSHS